MDENSIYARVLKNKILPDSIKKSVIIGSHWLFQGLLKMDRTERIFKILIDISLFVALSVIMMKSMGFYMSIFLAVFVAHSLNWIFNGQIFVSLKNLSLTENELEDFIIYSKNLKKRISNEESIIAAAIFGSLSRDELKSSSDLDVRIIRKPGFVNGFRGCVFVLLERSRAFFSKFPLDIIVLDNLESLKKLRKDEPPVVIHDPNKVFEEMHDETLSFDEIIFKYRSDFDMGDKR